jgi:hypothetical protein
VSTVLVVQPDETQADVLRAIFAKRVGAELVIADSAAEALVEIGARVPDLIMLSPMLSPRDEDALIAHLRSLDGASHLQTITIPQFRTTAAKKAPEKKGGLFRKKSKTPAPTGCDPMAFAEEVVARLKEASDIRRRPQTPRPAINVTAPSFVAEATVPQVQAFDTTPFQSRSVEPEPAAAEQADTFEESVSSAPPIFDAVEEPQQRWQSDPDPEPEPELEPVASFVEEIQPPVRMAPRSIEIDDIDRLARELGLDLKYVDAPEDPVEPVPVLAEDEDVFDFGAALDHARNKAATRRSVETADVLDAEAIRGAAIAEAREAAEREAREAVAVDLARVQAEAEAMREAAIAEARAAEALREAAVAEAREVAERAAREKLEAELARMRAETEVTVADALNKVRLETEEAERLRLEEARLRADEAERLRAEESRLRAEEAERVRAEAEVARAEAERIRIEAQEAQEAFAAELARVRAEVERSLASQLDAARAESERMRAAEATAARERAVVETQLKAELDRLKFAATQTRKADESEARKAADQIKQLEGELARVHAQTEQRQAAQLEELRAQMAEMREAAAQQARAAAAEAVASEVARATAHSSDSVPRKLNVVRMQPRVAAPEPPAREIERAVEELAARLEKEEAASASDYYSLFQPSEAPPVVEAVDEPFEFPGADIDYKRHAKWALPIAACLLLVTVTGTGKAVSTVTSTVSGLVTPDEKPALVVQRVNPDPFIEVIEQRVGSLKIESTPAGAEAVIDGKSYGKTPLTIPELAVGTHSLVLKSAAGSITRRVTIKNNQTTLLTEAIFSGWLAIFSPIPVSVAIDGRPVNLTDDGRLMTTPGKHVVELINDRFNYSARETLNVRPGETTAHTVSLPMGSVRVNAPEGAEIRIDGAAAEGSPSEGLSVAIGSHEISATHPSLGERRASVDVRHGNSTEVTLRFDQ